MRSGRIYTKNMCYKTWLNIFAWHKIILSSHDIFFKMTCKPIMKGINFHIDLKKCKKNKNKKINHMKHLVLKPRLLTTLSSWVLVPFNGCILFHYEHFKIMSIQSMWLLCLNYCPWARCVLLFTSEKSLPFPSSL